MINKFINFLAQRPVVLNFLRAVLENNHRGEKEVIKRELPARLSQRVFDLGCGTGTYSPLFGPEYVGIDISKIYIDYAKRHYAKNFYVMDGKKINFPSQSFDIIWVNGVFHHLDDTSALAILSEMKRLLKVGGRAVVMEDVPSKTIFSKILAPLDLGDNIRPPMDYRRLWEKYFVVQKEYPVRTGICDFQVFVLT
ncbi:methyltransferase type 11 [Candidatus Falkowbacteria bacterium CG10_big_fil_rev_8_21_14_0_10_44_15]|uniref:Methyltransferase type 11 n=1 Tax=Candidatus Falkowbacteria bacterium CG10_big_fil_rev_8_21_14_0_10_44_15 TaxID=1974569 RepID=A0A2H0V0B3_9BACT|nr:MAG: methyltransferase type 11 [Candidatus Falkowbacteria bacterium CG10_big_fil_rev_8_21_14_0_10_44_15]